MGSWDFTKEILLETFLVDTKVSLLLKYLEI